MTKARPIVSADTTSNEQRVSNTSPGGSPVRSELQRQSYKTVKKGG